MFPYFGKKQRHAALYPEPRYSLVIEPFAGSMGYTLHYRPARAIGIELDERVVDLWRRGERMGQTGVLPLAPDKGSKTDDLLVKVCSYSEHALTSGTMTVTSRMLRDWESVTRRMAEAGRWTKWHADYSCGSFLDAPDVEATWFVDPPYQHANRRGYRMGSKGIDYDVLAAWCMSRKGQVIVCEQEGADWLPFEPLYGLRSHRGSASTEVTWMTPAVEPAALFAA